MEQPEKVHAHHSPTNPSDTPITEKDGDITYSNTLRVKADPPDISDEDRRKKIKALAGAVSWGLRRFGEIYVRAIGKDATYKAVRAIIDASGLVAVHNHDLYVRPGYIMANDVVGKDEMTGICFLVVTSARSGSSKPSQDAPSHVSE